MTTFLMRNPAVTAFSQRDVLVFLRHRSPPLVVERVDVHRLSAAMERLASPLPGEQASDFLPPELLQLLLREKIVFADTRQQLLSLLPTPREKPCERLVFALTGAVAAVHAPSLIADLLREFCGRIDVIVSKAARHFVAPAALERIGSRVWSTPFAVKGEVNVPHIHLAESAEMIVVWPASAHTLHKLAHGACSDLISLTVAATSAPVVLIPGMNGKMWSNPAIGRNVAQLRKDGYYIVEPGIGFEVGKRTPTPEFGAPGIAGMGLTAVLANILQFHKFREAKDSHPSQ